MAHWRLYYHFVWATKNREPLLSPDIEREVFRHLRSEAEKMHAPLFVVGGTVDHVHALAAVRPAMSPAEFVTQLKGSSSRFVAVRFNPIFEWQDGYGVFSVSEEDVPRVVAYIERQKVHHSQVRIADEWEQTNQSNAGPQSNLAIGTNGYS